MFFFFFKQKTAYEMLRSLVGSEMCIRDRASISQAHTLPPAIASGFGNRSRVFSTEYDAMLPVAHSNIHKVCVSPWLMQPSYQNLPPSCGQLMDFPCLNLSRATWTVPVVPMTPTFKFGNWSVSCENRSCRARGHLALNVNPSLGITQVLVSSELAWASSIAQVTSSGWEPSWVAAGQVDWLAVFDQVQLSASLSVKSQRFHAGFDEMLPWPVSPNFQFACVRLVATDAGTARSSPVNMEPYKYQDSSFSTPSVFVRSQRARCFALALPPRIRTSFDFSL
eukprot:TRINITY_DN13236_c0_g1_i2.p1 TRINITY_DN13236_c0_g1~~TRINITY_DN13236_c0_g1_i2.p1  ORF type:complete len:280 (+),score=26.30 TRINITY_DN13236_c0_g1_i2:54-893(+)